MKIEYWIFPWNSRLITNVLDTILGTRVLETVHKNRKQMCEIRKVAFNKCGKIQELWKYIRVSRKVGKFFLCMSKWTARLPHILSQIVENYYFEKRLYLLSLWKMLLIHSLQCILEYFAVDLDTYTENFLNCPTFLDMSAFTN